MENIETIIQAAINDGTAKILTVPIAKELKGKRIITKYFGYNGQDGVDNFIVGEILSEYEIAEKRIDKKCFPQGNQAKYWESYMTPEQIDTKRKELQILTSDGRKTYIRTESFMNTFHCSDSDRFVYFIEA